MSTATLPNRVRIELPRLHLAQRSIKAEAARFNVVACGRRFGKTVLGEDVLIEPALRGKPVGWFAPTYKMLGEVWRDLIHALQPVTARANATERRIELVTGGVVECWSMDDPDPARGRKYQRVVIDEAAMIGHLVDGWQLAIRPSLTDLQGDAWFLSTPKGLNFFWTLFQWGQDPEQSEWRSWRKPTAENPFISPSEIEAARLDSPERAFAQEYLAEFIADSAGVFRGVDKVATGALQKDVIAGHTYVMGVDWGKLNDFTVISVFDATARRQVALDRFNKIDYTFQLERLAEHRRKWRPRMILAEQNSMGEPIIETAVRMGMPVTPWTSTNASKAEVIESLSLSIERGDLLLLDDPVQTAELHAYDMERLPSGLFRYGAPSGMHDDTVIALALAWQCVIAAQQPSKTKLRFGA